MTTSATRIALMGGSFNPPHIGHLLGAVYVRATLPVEQVWLMPSYQHPFRKQLESFDHRVEMCLALAADHGSWLKVSEVERDVPGEGRTVDTLEHLHAKYPDVQWRLIIGSDIVADLPQWKMWPRIQELASVTVLYRAGYPSPQAVGPPLAEVSSSAVRERLAQGSSVDELLPSKVLEYVRRHGLFNVR